MPKPAIPPSPESLALWAHEARLAAGMEIISKLYGTQQEAYDTETAYGWAVDYPSWAQAMPPPVRWLIPGYLPAGTIALLSGQSKYTRKTTTAMHLALAVATGADFAGITPEITGPVLYVLEEGAWSHTWERFAAVRDTLGLTTAQCMNLKIAFKNGLKLNGETPGKYNEWKKILIDTINQYNIVAVVLDSFSYMFHGDENKSEHLQDCIKTLQAVQKTGATVVVLAHLKKGAKSSEDPNEQIRGSSILRDILDFHLVLRNYKKKPNTITLDVIDRYGPPRATANVTWDIRMDRDTMTKCRLSIEGGEEEELW